MDQLISNQDATLRNYLGALGVAKNWGKNRAMEITCPGCQRTEHQHRVGKKPKREPTRSLRLL